MWAVALKASRETVSLCCGSSSFFSRVISSRMYAGAWGTGGQWWWWCNQGASGMLLANVQEHEVAVQSRSQSA